MELDVIPMFWRTMEDCDPSTRAKQLTIGYSRSVWGVTRRVHSVQSRTQFQRGLISTHIKIGIRPEVDRSAPGTRRSSEIFSTDSPKEALREKPQSTTSLAVTNSGESKECPSVHTRARENHTFPYKLKKINKVEMTLAHRKLTAWFKQTSRSMGTLWAKGELHSPYSRMKETWKWLK